MKKGYVEHLVNKFNKATGMNVDYRKIANAFDIISDSALNDEKNRNKIVDYYCDQYKEIFKDVCKGVNNKTKQVNFVQEFDGMMTEIFNSELEPSLKTKENGININFGSTGEGGKTELEVAFKEVKNEATDIEEEMKRGGDYTEYFICNRLENAVNAAKNIDSLGETGAMLKVVRDHYNSKSFFQRLFKSSRERKLIKEAKKKIVECCKPNGYKMKRGDTERFCKAAIGQSYNYQRIVYTMNNPSEKSPVTDYRAEREIYENKNKVKDANIQKEKDIIKKQNTKEIKTQMYKEFTDKYKELAGDSKEQQAKRHEEFNKYFKDPEKYNQEHEKAKNESTREPAEINNPDFEVGSYNPSEKETNEIKNQLISKEEEFHIDVDELNV